jgi:four helix bundle protein
MAENVFNHRDLIVWQKAIELVNAVYDISESWPKAEVYGLTSQIRRACVSIPSNIAEGNGRTTTPDYLRFLDHSFGSLMEVDTQLHIARHRGYIKGDAERQLEGRITEIAKMLNGLIASLKRRQSESGERGRRANPNL